MDGAKLQARVYKGRGIVGNHIGLPCQQYRPVLASNPFSKPLAVINAAFNAADSTYLKPGLYGKPAWFGDFDGRLTQVGDYLKRISDGSFWFIAGQQTFLPIVVISCNRIVSVFRPQQQSGVGAQGYGGNTALNETPLITGYPASVTTGPRADKSMVSLPGDAKTPYWSILLPVLPGGVVLKGNDAITDDLDRRYVISSPELSDLGWRINATQAET